MASPRAPRGGRLGPRRGQRPHARWPAGFGEEAAADGAPAGPPPLSRGRGREPPGLRAGAEGARGGGRGVPCSSSFWLRRRNQGPVGGVPRREGFSASSVPAVDTPSFQTRTPSRAPFFCSLSRSPRPDHVRLLSRRGPGSQAPLRGATLVCCPGDFGTVQKGKRVSRADDKLEKRVAGPSAATLPRSQVPPSFRRGCERQRPRPAAPCPALPRPAQPDPSGTTQSQSARAETPGGGPPVPAQLASLGSSACRPAGQDCRAGEPRGARKKKPGSLRQEIFVEVRESRKTAKSRQQRWLWCVTEKSVGMERPGHRLSDVLTTPLFAVTYKGRDVSRVTTGWVSQCLGH
ncbi:translation initiation factor IF-2-like [Camelus ferus]|uniref:Translation initiation factor IF-2-like n=2 Tax=Camelus TaxID=9836 RepID=A0A8B8TGG5_CAMFR|nr:translation initiation factor IF-2-like [Camelus ferus]